MCNWYLLLLGVVCSTGCCRVPPGAECVFASLLALPTCTDRERLYSNIVALAYVRFFPTLVATAPHRHDSVCCGLRVIFCVLRLCWNILLYREDLRVISSWVSVVCVCVCNLLAPIANVSAH